MSGLEPFAALGLVCNILQLVEVGRKTIDCIKTVYQEGKLDQDLEQNAVVLENLTNEVKKESRPGNKKYETVLLQSAASCSTAARDLQEELRFLFGNAKRGSIASAVKVTATVKWRQRRLERLSRGLDTEETRLQTSLLAQVWSNTNAAHLDIRGVRRELRYFIEQYRQGRRETTELVSSEGLKTRELVSREAQRTNDAMALVDEKLNHLMIHQGAQIDDNVRERFLQSLKYPGFNQRRNQIDSAHADTLKWIFVGDDESEPGEDHDSRYISDKDSETASESELSTVSSSEASHLEDEDEGQCFISKIKWDSFSNWLRSTDTIYWISGKPGSGKTTLVKYAVTHPQTRMYLDFWSPGCEIASHYFWRPGFPMQKSSEGLFCSLLYQLLSNNKTRVGEVMSFVSGPKDTFTDWSSTELRSVLSRALSFCKKGVCLFLDGIDEIDPEDGTKDGIPELLELVSELSQTGKIKFCLASRPEPYILEMKLSMHPRLRLQDLNYADLMAYTRERVQYPQTKKSKEYHDLAHSLVNRAEGVFLWLLLAIKSINEGFSYHDNVETLTERMNRLPKGLHRLYEDMWQRAGADSPAKYRQTAALYFKLIIATRSRRFYPDRRPDMLIIRPGGINIFDLMLATTAIPGKVLEALNEPSKLIREEVLQQKCQDVERKLKIYCMGLVEVRTGNHEVRPENLVIRQEPTLSWYGLTYDRLRRIATTPALQFIHRTASDFLTETESGRKILDHDTSSDCTLQFDLMEGLLARLALFAEQRSVDDWALELKRIRKSWKGSEEWPLKDWDRLILICEKLANSGRLFRGDVREAASCGGINFLKAVAWFNIDDGFVISSLKNGNLTKKEKSAVLFSLSDPEEELESRPRTFRELLRTGADPNWQIWDKSPDMPFAILQTPWQNYLSKMVEEFTRDEDFAKSPTRLGAIAEILVEFVSEGAALDEMVHMRLEWDQTERQWHAMSIGWRDHIEPSLFASIPAYFIVETLADTIPLYRLSNKESYVDSCVVLKEASATHRSGRQCRVIGKVRHDSPQDEANHEPMGDGPYVLWETTKEMQVELGNRLSESLKRQISSTDYFEQEVADDLIFNDENWFVRTRGNTRAMFKRLEELDLLKAADLSPGIEEWVRKSTHRISQPGGTT